MGGSPHPLSKAWMTVEWVNRVIVSIKTRRQDKIRVKWSNDEGQVQQQQQQQQQMWRSLLSIHIHLYVRSGTEADAVITVTGRERREEKKPKEKAEKRERDREEEVANYICCKLHLQSLSPHSSSQEKTTPSPSFLFIIQLFSLPISLLILLAQFFLRNVCNLAAFLCLLLVQVR